MDLFRDLWQDLRYGVRTLAKNPGFTIVAVIALALGIGANSAIFSVVNTVLLRPLPFKEPERLVMVWEDATKHGYPRDTPAAANYIDWRDQNQVFEGMAAIADLSFNLTGIDEPERIDGRRVSASLFTLLGVERRESRGHHEPWIVATPLRFRYDDYRQASHLEWRELHGRRRHAATVSVSEPGG